MAQEEKRTDSAQPVDSREESALRQDGSSAAEKKPRPRKALLTACVVAAIIVVAGAGFWVWHEQPSFCNALCHIPMNPYNKTYDQAPDTAGVDKWGNEVTNTSAMLCVSHQAAKNDGGAEATCLSCHVPTIGEQVSEGLNWVSGNYEVVSTKMDMWAATERDTNHLTEARGVSGDEFCLNEACHNITRDDLIELTSDLDFNPHVPQHGKQDCTTCHKGHRASVMYCAPCHSDAEIPEGWITPAEQEKLLLEE